MSVLPTSVYLNPTTPLFQPYGSGGGSAISTFTEASISSLTVSSINGAVPNSATDWALFPAIANVNMNGSNIQQCSGLFGSGLGVGTNPVSVDAGLVNTLNLNGSNITIGSYNPAGKISFENSFAEIGSITPAGLSINAVNTSSITASSITAVNFTALSTVNVISTISTTNIDAGEIITDKLFVTYGTGVLEVSQAVAGGGGGMRLNAPSTVATVFTTGKTDGQNNYLTMGIGANDPNGFLEYNTSSITRGLISFQESLAGEGLGIPGGIKLVAQGGSSYPVYITPSSLVTNNISTFTLQVADATISSINGNDITFSTVNIGENATVSSISGDGADFDKLTATAFSSLGAEIKQGLFSSIVFNPTFDPSFPINIDTGFAEIGTGLGAIGAGLLTLTVALPVGGYQFGYGLGKGLNSASEPRQIENINSNIYESYNFASQLQVSTLGEQISTIFRTISTIPSTIIDLNMSTLATEVNIEIFTSTLSGPAPVKVMRAVADPLQLVSTPWTYEQGFGQWVEIPDGVPSNISTLGLSTLQLLPSTVLKGDTDGAILEVIESASGDYGEVKSAGYWISLSNTDPNFGIIARNSNNNPVWIDSNIGTNPFALQGKGVQFSTIGIQTSTPQSLLDVGSLNYSSPTSLATFGGSRDGTLEVTLQNKSTGSNATAFFFAVDNTGGEYAGFGVNSLNLSNLYSTLFELPGASIQSGTLDCVIGPQSDHSSNSGIYLTYQDGAFAHHINSNGALSFNASYDGTVSEGDFGTSGNVVVSQGPGAQPVWTNSLGLSNINISTSAIVTGLTINDANYGIPQNLISTIDGGSLIYSFSNLASPTGIYTVINNLDTNPVYRGKANIQMSGQHSTIGINKIPLPGFTLDVEGDLRAKIGHFSAVYASSLLATSTFAEVQSDVGTVDLTPNSAWWVSVNSGIVSGDGQGLIKFGNSEVMINGYNGGENYQANQYYPGYYAGGSWTNVVGRTVRVEYSVATDSSFGGGLGMAEFVLPVGFSTLGSFQGTYVAFGDSNPGLTHPIWLYSTITDGAGQISTIQVGGGQNSDLFVSVLGYV